MVNSSNEQHTLFRQAAANINLATTCVVPDLHATTLSPTSYRPAFRALAASRNHAMPSSGFSETIKVYAAVASGHFSASYKSFASAPAQAAAGDDIIININIL